MIRFEQIKTDPDGPDKRLLQQKKVQVVSALMDDNNAEWKVNNITQIF